MTTGMTRPRIVGLLLLLGLGAPGCWASPGEAMSRHYNTSLPASVRVAHFTGDAFKDPWFLWELTPVRDDFLKRLVANARLKPAAADTPREDPYGHDNIRWWPAKKLPGLTEMYFLDEDSSQWRVWVDRKANRMWVMFVNN